MRPDYSNIQPFAVIYHSNNLGYTESPAFSNMDGMFSDIPAKKQRSSMADSILGDKGNQNKPYKPVSKADAAQACAAILAKIKTVKEKLELAWANGDNATVGQLNILYTNLYAQYEKLCPKKAGGKATYSNAYGSGLMNMVIRDPETGNLITETSVAAKSNAEEKKSLYDWVSLGLGAATGIFGKKDSTSTSGTTNVVVQGADKAQGISPITIGVIVLGVAALGAGMYFVFKK